MSQAPYPEYPAYPAYPGGPPPVPPTQNTAGLVGFIVSMCGLLCGLAFPVGMIISLFGLKSQPKGFAIAGSIVGAVGTLLLVALVAIYAVMIAAFVGMMPNLQQSITTINSVQQAQQVIEQHRLNNGDLPDAETGNQLIAGSIDGWQTPLRYDHGVDEGSNYHVRSAGPDRVFDTADDITIDQSGVMSGDAPGLAPAFQPQPPMNAPLPIDVPERAMPPETAIPPEARPTDIPDLHPPAIPLDTAVPDDREP
jgi:hypothetical protein